MPGPRMSVIVKRLLPVPPRLQIATSKISASPGADRGVSDFVHRQVRIIIGDNAIPFASFSQASPWSKLLVVICSWLLTG